MGKQPVPPILEYGSRARHDRLDALRSIPHFILGLCLGFPSAFAFLAFGFGRGVPIGPEPPRNRVEAFYLSFIVIIPALIITGIVVTTILTLICLLEPRVTAPPRRFSTILGFANPWLLVGVGALVAPFAGEGTAFDWMCLAAILLLFINPILLTRKRRSI